MRLHRGFLALVLLAGCHKGGVSGEARENRQRVVTLVAPAPMPTEAPLVGPSGVDADGYPLRFVDRAGVRSLLYHHDFDDLTKYIEQWQSDFEADPRKEYWPFDAASAFDTAEPELREHLDAWVTAKPTSFAPLLARGTYFTAMGFTRRGGLWAKDTPNADMQAMDDAFAPAVKDLAQALTMRPKAFAAARALLQIAAAKGDHAGKRRTVDMATSECPSCFQIRSTYMFHETPRWGGSYEAMTAYATTAPKDRNPRLRLLAGYVDYDAAQTGIDNKEYDAALVAINRAAALGEHWLFLELRARIERDLHAVPAAKRDVDRALELRPGLPELLFLRAGVNDELKDWEGEARDLLDGMRVTATDAHARHLMPRAVQGLTFQAAQSSKAGDSRTALRLLDLAADLAPNDINVQRWRGAVIRGGASDAGPTPSEPAAPGDPAAAAPPGADPPEVVSAAARAKGAPDDFEAHRSLDYTLAQIGKFDRVVTMWNEYIAAHPKEGRAYLERGGAQFHLGHLPEAKADATKACDLGVSEGCARAKQVRAR